MMTPDPWVIRPRPSPAARLRLFCVPCAGRGASFYRGWSELIDLEVELCVLQLPGRETRLREPAFTRMADAAENTAEALERYLDLPFAFFGHSMGATLSFELARRLRGRFGIAPIHLFVSARRAPQQQDSRSPLRDLPDGRFIKEICQRYNGIPRELLAEPELLEMLLPVLRADVTMLETYSFEPGSPLGCPLTALGGTEDYDLHMADLEGWREHTSAHFEARLFPGDHFFVHSATKQVLETISRSLHIPTGLERSVL